MENLVRCFSEGNAILFVGGGVSMNLGLPEWRELIARLAAELGYEEQVFTSYGDPLLLAEYYQSVKGSLAPLLRWMDSTWHSSSIHVEESQIHRLIVEIAPPLIYTTNYDCWLEKAFEYYGKEYVPVVTVRDVTKIRPGVTQIVKLHGDVREPDSIVLSESSYFERLDFESPLDIKLRSDSLGRTILFIGYRLSDINIRYLVYRLQRLWESSRCADSRPRSYLFLPHRNPVQELVLRKRGIVTLFSERENPGEGLRDFLERLLSGMRGRGI